MAKLPLFPTVGKTLKNAGVELYRSMGYSIATSLVWFLGFLPIVFLGMTTLGALPNIVKDIRQLPFTIFFCFLVISFLNGLLLGPITTALFGLFQERKEGYPSIKSFFKQFTSMYWLSARVNWVYSLVASILIFNILLLMVEKSVLMLVAGVCSLYALLLLAMISFYLHPLIYYRKKFREVFKKAFLLVIDNLGVSFFLVLLLGIVFIISGVLAFLVLLFFGAFYIYFIDYGFERVSSRYEVASSETAGEE